METEKRGRGHPTFKPTKPQRDEVMRLKAYGMAEPEIASVLGICQNTLRKHFADELQFGRSRKVAENLERLEKAAKKGNVTAMKFLASVTETLPPPPAPEPKPEPLGKKQQAVVDAQTAHEDSGWSDLVH